MSVFMLLFGAVLVGLAIFKDAVATSTYANNIDSESFDLEAYYAASRHSFYIYLVGTALFVYGVIKTIN